MTFRFDFTSRFPALYGEGEPPISPEYVVFAMPTCMRCEDGIDDDNPVRLVERILGQIGGTLVSSDHAVFQEAKRRVLAHGYIEVPDDKWPFTFLVQDSPQRLVVTLQATSEPEIPFLANPMVGFT